MQKLSAKLKNVPKDASQVLCSTSSQLNKDQSLSVENGLKNSKLTDNIPDVNKVQQTGRSVKAKVFVLKTKFIPCLKAGGLL